MEKYRVLEKIGAGAHGEVFVVEERTSFASESGSGCGGAGEDRRRRVLSREGKRRTWVMKVIPLPEGKENKASCLKEAATMLKLSHPCIVACKESFIDPEEGIFCIAMERCMGGELRHFIAGQKEQGKLLVEEQVVDWLLQLLLAVEYLHHKNVLHRDLKSENVFLRSQTDFPHGNFASVQLGDFGISRVLKHSEEKANSFVGTPLYMSPELIRNEPYNHKSDIWALGCILYEMMCLRKPFEAETVPDLVYLVLKTEYPDPPPCYSPELCFLLDKMLQKDAAERPSATTLLSFPLLRERTAKFLASCREFAEDAQAASEELRSPSFVRRYEIHKEVMHQARRLGLRLSLSNASAACAAASLASPMDVCPGDPEDDKGRVPKAAPGGAPSARAKASGEQGDDLGEAEGVEAGPAGAGDEQDDDVPGVVKSASVGSARDHAPVSPPQKELPLRKLSRSPPSGKEPPKSSCPHGGGKVRGGSGDLCQGTSSFKSGSGELVERGHSRHKGGSGDLPGPVQDRDRGGGGVERQRGGSGELSGRHRAGSGELVQAECEQRRPKTAVAPVRRHGSGILRPVPPVCEHGRQLSWSPADLAAPGPLAAPALPVAGLAGPSSLTPPPPGALLTPPRPRPGGHGLEREGVHEAGEDSQEARRASGELQRMGKDAAKKRPVRRRMSHEAGALGGSPEPPGLSPPPRPGRDRGKKLQRGDSVGAGSMRPAVPPYAAFHLGGFMQSDPLLQVDSEDLLDLGGEDHLSRDETGSRGKANFLPKKGPYAPTRAGPGARQGEVPREGNEGTCEGGGEEAHAVHAAKPRHSPLRRGNSTGCHAQQVGVRHVAPLERGNSVGAGSAVSCTERKRRSLSKGDSPGLREGQGPGCGLTSDCVQESLSPPWRKQAGLGLEAGLPQTLSTAGDMNGLAAHEDGRMYALGGLQCVEEDAGAGEHDGPLQSLAPTVPHRAQGSALGDGPKPGVRNGRLQRGASADVSRLGSVDLPPTGRRVSLERGNSAGAWSGLAGSPEQDPHQLPRLACAGETLVSGSPWVQGGLPGSAAPPTTDAAWNSLLVVHKGDEGCAAVLERGNSAEAWETLEDGQGGRLARGFSTGAVALLESGAEPAIDRVSSCGGNRKRRSPYRSRNRPPNRTPGRTPDQTPTGSPGDAVARGPSQSHVNSPNQRPEGPRGRASERGLVRTPEHSPPQSPDRGSRSGSRRSAERRSLSSSSKDRHSVSPQHAALSLGLVTAGEGELVDLGGGHLEMEAEGEPERSCATSQVQGKGSDATPGQAASIQEQGVRAGSHGQRTDASEHHSSLAPEQAREGDMRPSHKWRRSADEAGLVGGTLEASAEPCLTEGHMEASSPEQHGGMYLSPLGNQPEGDPRASLQEDARVGNGAMSPVQVEGDPKVASIFEQSFPASCSDSSSTFFDTRELPVRPSSAQGMRPKPQAGVSLTTASMREQEHGSFPLSATYCGVSPRPTARGIRTPEASSSGTPQLARSRSRSPVKFRLPFIGSPWSSKAPSPTRPGQTPPASVSLSDEGEKGAVHALRAMFARLQVSPEEATEEARLQRQMDASPTRDPSDSPLLLSPTSIVARSFARLSPRLRPKLACFSHPQVEETAEYSSSSPVQADNGGSGLSGYDRSDSGNSGNLSSTMSRQISGREKSPQSSGGERAGTGPGERDSEDSDSSWLREVISGMQKLPKSAGNPTHDVQPASKEADSSLRSTAEEICFDEQSWKRLAEAAASVRRGSVPPAVKDPRHPPVIMLDDSSPSITSPCTPRDDTEVASPHMRHLLAKAQLSRVFGPSRRRHPRRPPRNTRKKLGGT